VVAQLKFKAGGILPACAAHRALAHDDGAGAAKLRTSGRKKRQRSGAKRAATLPLTNIPVICRLRQ
jgi:hypothetical protein